MAEEKPKLHCASYGLYYLVLFFAHWFGAHRFDMDGDGDFDPEDVEAYLADKGLLSKNFRQTKTGTANKKKSDEKKKKEGDASQVDDMFASAVEGKSKEDVMKENLFQKQILPWFIIVECVLVLGLWFIMAMIDSQDTPGEDPLALKAGIDSFKPGWFDLRLSTGCGDAMQDQRFEAWRWWTYQWTHIGAMHVLMNVFLNVMLGIPLEGLHGTLRMVFMYNVGVFGGSCCYFVNDAHTIVVGCSGGCYALIGMHFAELSMNWKQTKFRWPTLVFISLLVGVDLFSYYMSLGSANTSHSAHVGGFIAGLIIGVLVGKNLKVLAWEKVLMFLIGIIGFLLVVFSIVWLVLNPVPQNIWEVADGQAPWCWVKQIYSVEIDQNQWRCVRCGDQTCIDSWMPFRASDVSADVCTEQNRWYADAAPDSR